MPRPQHESLDIHADAAMHADDGGEGGVEEGVVLEYGGVVCRVVVLCDVYVLAEDWVSCGGAEGLELGGMMGSECCAVRREVLRAGPVAMERR